jgi:hypothetical protein
VRCARAPLRHAHAGPILGALAACLAFAPAARAGGEAAAEALFAEAKSLVAQKRYAEACPKFAESNRLDRGAGTLIHLADCYENNKQTASAWATYKEAASAAQAIDRKPWETLANKRAAALEPRLARITVLVPAPVSKIEVARDGEKLTEASWGVALPADVGAHTVEGTAPGFKPFTLTVAVAKDGERKEVVVPRLEALPAAVVAAPAAPEAPAPGRAPADDASVSRGGGQRSLGLLAAGVGIAGLAVGAVTGVLAMGKNDDGKALCPTAGACGSREGVDAIASAKSLGAVATIGFGAGGALLVSGAVLYLTAPASRTPPLRVVPALGAQQAGVSLGGAF